MYQFPCAGLPPPCTLDRGTGSHVLARFQLRSAEFSSQTRDLRKAACYTVKPFCRRVFLAPLERTSGLPYLNVLLLLILPVKQGYNSILIGADHQSIAGVEMACFSSKSIPKCCLEASSYMCWTCAICENICYLGKLQLSSTHLVHRGLRRHDQRLAVMLPILG